MDSLPFEPQGKPKNTGVGSLSLLQGIFLTQASNPALSCLLLVGGFFTTSVTWDALRFCRLFPHSLAVKESTCNAGDPGSIPASGRSAREGIGYPHQYSWASLVAHRIKNSPAMQETWAQSLGWEDSLEEIVATHSSILVWRIPTDRGAWWATVHGVAKSHTQLSD